MRVDRDFVKNLLRQACSAGATDVHLKVPGRPSFRIEDELVPTAFDRLLPQDTFRAAHSLMELAQVDMPLARVHETEFALGLTGIGRFRVHLFRQRGSFGVVIHRIQVEVPTLETLGVAPGFADFHRTSGLVLVGGGRRQELLAGLADARNASGPGHLIVIEDRLEFLHKDNRASISQREVGIDTESYLTGLRSATYLDADWIALGEVPDHCVAEAALRVAESGRCLVLAGVPAGDPSRAVEWFVTRFSDSREPEVRQRVAEVLAGAVTLNTTGPERLVVDRAIRQSVRQGAPLPSRLAS